MTKSVILAGGFGTRISEETQSLHKPLIKIGSAPILWHIMKTYDHHGIRDFIICLGYKGDLIKKFFYDYSTLNSDLCIDLQEGSVQVFNRRTEDWRVTLVDTGLDTMTGGRLKRIADYLDPTQPFCFTYGDGVGDVDISASLKFHREQGKLATVTAVTPPGRFGVLDVDGNIIKGFREKIASDQYKVNAGYFVLDKAVVDYINDDETIWEQEPMVKLSEEGNMNAWHHDGFWMPMDTLRDKITLNRLWENGSAPWKVW